MAMKMDLNGIIEQIEAGDQDSALTALQSYNKEVNISSVMKCEVQHTQLRGSCVVEMLYCSSI